LKLKKDDLEFYVTGEEELFLSGKDLAELLQDTTSKGYLFRFKVKGFSMSPFIKDNDVVTISPLINSKISLGILVAFIHPETQKLVIHRAIRRSKNVYLIKGDNVPVSDGMVLVENILGQVTQIERKGRRISFGIGPERFVVALLSRMFLALPFSFSIWRFMRLGAKKIKNGYIFCFRD